MKKIFNLTFCLVILFLITSCAFEPTKCVHEASEWIIDKEATCEVDGKEHTECTKCKKVLETKTIEKLGHDIIHHEALEATCTTKGHNAYDTCSRCDYTTYEETSIGGHTPSDWIVDVEATKTSDGKRHKECTLCHEVLEEEEYSLIKHQYELVRANEATTDKEAYIEYKCIDCGYTKA